MISADLISRFKTAQSPAVFCSFGASSSLLLRQAQLCRQDFPVYFLGEQLPSVAARMVAEDGLTIHSFAPRRRCLAHSTLINEYAFNGVSVPILSPTIQSNNCKHQHMRSASADFYFPHDAILWGYRRADEHPPLLPEVKFDREIEIGWTKFIAPLYDLTTDQVLNELDVLGLEYAHDEPVDICANCMNALLFNATTLAGFQERPF